MDTRLSHTLFLVAGIAIVLVLVTGAPTQAAPFPNKCYCGFWDFSSDLFMTGVPFGFIFSDCFAISSNNQICSNFFGCGPFKNTGASGSRITWEGQITGIGFFGGGLARQSLERPTPGTVSCSRCSVTRHSRGRRVRSILLHHVSAHQNLIDHVTQIKEFLHA